MIVGAWVVAAVLVLVLLYGGISGISLNAPSSASEYTVTFDEMGLPTGQGWQVSLTPYMISGRVSTLNSTSPVIQFLEPNGIYVFDVTSESGYAATPRTGSVAVNGSDRSIAVSFAGIPLGSVFGWGTPVNESGTTSFGCGPSSTTYCYSIEIAGASGVYTSDILLTLRNDVGATVPWSPQDTVSLFSPTTVSAIATYDIIGTWTLVPPFSGQFAAGDTIVITTPTTESAGLLGIEIAAVGENGFSGIVASNAFS